MVKLTVGNDYTTRSGARVTITKELGILSPWYEDGFRFEGTTAPDTEKSHYTITVMLFREDGKQFSNSYNALSTPFDIVDYFRETPEMVTLVDVKIGDVVGVICNNHIKSGLFKGWEITNLFKIAENTMTDIIYSIPRDKHPFSGQIFVISIAPGGLQLEGCVGSVLVTYEDDNQCYIAALHIPEEFLKG